jgi:integrase/recombinase XerC
MQDQILFEVAYDSANRLGALLKLKLSSLNLNKMLFEDVREKRGYHVEVVFEDKAKELISKWIEMRKEDYDKLEIDYLFITLYKKEYRPMSRSAMHERMQKIGKIVGINDFRCHCVRKSKLNNVYEETGDLTLAADLANHKSIETTKQSYIKPKSKAELRAKISALRHKNKTDNEVTEVSENIAELKQ